LQERSRRDRDLSDKWAVVGADEEDGSRYARRKQRE